jgi:chorismate dehydratase
MRIGVVNYLNSKPLVFGLDRLAPDARVAYDLPSRLSDSLAAGRVDVALIPSVELFRSGDYKIVSNACVACCGPVLSVKLHFRVPPTKVARVALDEGSRTSVALAKILLRELAGARPHWESLPIGCGIDSTDADAVLLIGDRAMLSSDDDFVKVWDLGQRWYEWTGLPFVFALWVARRDLDTADLAVVLTAARDLGAEHLDEIATNEAPLLGIGQALAARYLRENLHFAMDQRERDGLLRYYRLCVEHGLAPPGRDQTLETHYADGCPSP